MTITFLLKSALPTCRKVVEALFPKTDPAKDGEWSVDALLKKAGVPSSSGRGDEVAPKKPEEGPKAENGDIKVGPPPPPDLSDPKVKRAQEAKLRGDEAFKVPPYSLYLESIFFFVQF